MATEPRPTEPWPWVRTVVDLDEVDSTSDRAKALVAGPVALPLLVRAGRQTRGRGRGLHTWWSDEGSLTFSLALDPQAHGLRPDQEPRLALTAAVAAIEAIETFGSTSSLLGIRWPNDIEAGGRKLGGLLPERVETERGPRLVLGLGLNVTTRFDDAPEDVRRLATSLTALGIVGIDHDALLLAFLERIGAAIDRLATDDASLAERWASLDTLRGAPVAVDLGTQVVRGIGAGIDAHGALRLTTADGPITIHGGQVLR